MPGRFIVIEGPEGAGKTTLARHLAERIRAAGRNLVEVREPGGTPLAEAARQLALTPDMDVSPRSELFLILAARADLVSRVIKPALAAGQWVLSDRFDLSTEMYQVEGRGLPRDEVLAANRLATGGLRPDLTLILDIPVETGSRRLGGAGKELDRLEQEGDDFHHRITEAYTRVTGPDVIHLDGAADHATVAGKAWDILRERFGTMALTPGLNE